MSVLFMYLRGEKSLKERKGERKHPPTTRKISSQRA